MRRPTGPAQVVCMWLLVGIAARAGAGEAAGRATVTGMVRDGDSGRPLPFATVSLAGEDRATIADSTGRYALAYLVPGTHDLAARFVGYASRRVQVLVPAGGTLALDIALVPEPIRLPAIQVRTSIPIAGLDPPSLSTDREVTMAALRDHPLLAEPDALQALGGGEVTIAAETPSGLHVRGGASDQTAYLLDGIPVLSPYHAAGLFSAWNPDALAHVELASSAPPAASPHALSGIAAAVTRPPDASLQARGSVSTTHARLTVDGPLGTRGAGYLVSVRSGYPSGLAPRTEGSYVEGETGDMLAKIEAPVLGGRFRVLGYSSENDLSTAAQPKLEGAAGAGGSRNDFDWASQSLGTVWSGAVASMPVEISSWIANSTAGALWNGALAPVDMVAARHDAGFAATVTRGGAAASTSAGLRVERIGTSYRVEPDSVLARWETGGRASIITPFVEHRHTIHERTDLLVGASLAATAGRLYGAPRARVRWRTSERLAFTASYARLHQFAQSLRNTESVAGAIFPVDLYVGAGAPGVPVARSDLGVLGATLRPRPSVRIVAQVYERSFHDLLLVAPLESEPFATAGFAVGSGTARGLSIEAAWSTPRFGLLAGYGLQRVRFDGGASAYVPEHGAEHSLQAGMLVTPRPTWAVRVGFEGAMGRRGTPLAGVLEWEAPNLLDRGSEFGGSPRLGGPLGGASLPSYLRLDVGVRKSWKMRVAARYAVLAVYGTVTNVLNRGNVLTYATDPATGRPVEIEMRPLAPLVAGLDWRF
jgi:hypothetical protein